MTDDKRKLNIYLDNCCFNRPYDNQKQLRIELETKAKLFIQDQIVKGKIDLTTSYILELENSDNPFDDRRLSISTFFEYSSATIVESDDIIKNAKDFVSQGLKAHDALHVASAIDGKCDYFLTTDDRLLKFKDARIRIMNPVDCIRELEDSDYDE